MTEAVARVSKITAASTKSFQDAVEVGLGRAADHHVELGGERVVIGEPPRDQPVGAAKQCAGRVAGECAPLGLESAKRSQIAHHADFDRHPSFERITACKSLRVAVGNVGC